MAAHHLAFEFNTRRQVCGAGIKWQRNKRLALCAVEFEDDAD